MVKFGSFLTMLSKSFYDQHVCVGDLKMAAARNSSLLDSDLRNERRSVNIQFFDGDEVTFGTFYGSPRL